MNQEEKNKVEKILNDKYIYMSPRDILKWLADRELVRARECKYNCYYHADSDDYITNDCDSGDDALDEVLECIDYNDFKREYEDEFPEEEEDDE